MVRTSCSYSPTAMLQYCLASSVKEALDLIVHMALHICDYVSLQHNAILLHEHALQCRIVTMAM